jgi:hypothetical protein
LGGCGGRAVPTTAACICCAPPTSGATPKALCGQRVPAEGLTITRGLSWALCVTRIVGIPAGMVDPDPRTTAPLIAGRRSVER